MSVLRLRVFAGPNGSGKSIMKNEVERTEINGRAVDLGTYVNADLIAKTLREKRRLDLATFGVEVDRVGFRKFATASGLLGSTFPKHRFVQHHRMAGSVLTLVRHTHVEHFAQLIAAFLCEQLLLQHKKFSFETVFSHTSKIQFMQRASDQGYKVYLYFIATNSPEINVDRVRIRVERGGHNVQRHKIISRYTRSLRQILPAIPFCYHAFFFDNSKEFNDQKTGTLLFAEMKKTTYGLNWAWHTERIPDWFIREYLLASKDPLYEDVARQALEDRKGTA